MTGLFETLALAGAALVALLVIGWIILTIATAVYEAVQYQQHGLLTAFELMLCGDGVKMWGNLISPERVHSVVIGAGGGAMAGITVGSFIGLYGLVETAIPGEYGYDPTGVSTLGYVVMGGIGAPVMGLAIGSLIAIVTFASVWTALFFLNYILSLLKNA